MSDINELYSISDISDAILNDIEDKTVDRDLEKYDENIKKVEENKYPHITYPDIKNKDQYKTFLHDGIHCSEHMRKYSDNEAKEILEVFENIKKENK